MPARRAGQYAHSCLGKHCVMDLGQGCIASCTGVPSQAASAAKIVQNSLACLAGNHCIPVHHPEDYGLLSSTASSIQAFQHL